MRVGIATGLVVVGELLGTGEAQERNVVGETPNLAARLQSAAAPNTVVIAATTRRLAGELFEYEAIAPAALKGFAEPVTIWRVLRERTIASRFEALRAEARTPLVGRQEEMELLLRRWEQIKEGEGRVVLLAGEPGIGKSRLTAALEDNLKDEGHICLRYFCQPHHQGSVLQPVIAQFQHAADFAPNDSRADKRAKIEALLAALPGEDADLAPILELLGLSDEGLDRRQRSAARPPAAPECLDQATRGARTQNPGLDAVRGYALGRSDFARASNADHGASAKAAGPARRHLSSGISAALDRPAARDHARRSTGCRSASAPRS